MKPAKYIFCFFVICSLSQVIVSDSESSENSSSDKAKNKDVIKLQCSGSYSRKNGKNKTKIKPNSCKEVVNNIQSKVIVTLSSGLEVMCDTETDGGGWLVIQRRINGKLNFYRGWEDYKKGFGDYVNGEFYLGNENIHRISTNGNYELRIDFEYLKRKYYARYSRFILNSETSGYSLYVTGYSGDAGDSLSNHNYMKFSTFDKDQDNTRYTHCAVTNQGAWWYNNCGYSNLNGQWGSYVSSRGVNWAAITGYSASATRTEMKIRKLN